MDLSTIKFNNWEQDVEPILKGAILKKIDSQKNSYKSGNVCTAATNLVTLGKLLSITFSSSIGIPTAEHIINLLSLYQTFVHESFLASNNFNEVTLKVLKNHHFANIMCQKKKYDKAATFISKCTKTSEQMITVCTGLVEKAEVLEKNSKKALNQTRENQKLKDDQKDDQNEATEAMKEEQGSTELTKLLKNLQLTNDKFDIYVNSMTACCKILEEIKTLFVNIRIFWEGNIKKCQLLEKYIIDVSVNLVNDATLVELFPRAIHNSGIQWLAFGKDNHQVSKIMIEAKENMDNLMNNLPSSEEGQSMINELIPKILENINLENATSKTEGN